MSKYNWLIDAGHGGMTSKGVYTTAPAKMFRFPDGYVIYEGQVNRKIAAMVAHQLFDRDIDHALIYDEINDTPLSARSSIANRIWISDRRTVVLSIHSNASPDPSKPGAGFEVFTSPGQTRSDFLAQVFCKNYIADFPDFRFRPDNSDGDHDKEAKFHMVTAVQCPAILVENLFMDNRKEAEFLNSQAGQLMIANSLVKSILECEKL